MTVDISKDMCRYRFFEKYRKTEATTLLAKGATKILNGCKSAHRDFFVNQEDLILSWACVDSLEEAHISY